MAQTQVVIIMMLHPMASLAGYVICDENSKDIPTEGTVLAPNKVQHKRVSV